MFFFYFFQKFQPNVSFLSTAFYVQVYWLLSKWLFKVLPITHFLLTASEIRLMTVVFANLEEIWILFRLQFVWFKGFKQNSMALRKRSTAYFWWKKKAEHFNWTEFFDIVIDNESETVIVNTYPGVGSRNFLYVFSWSFTVLPRIISIINSTTCSWVGVP